MSELPMCAGCGEPFSFGDWMDRHQDHDGYNYHADPGGKFCCPECEKGDYYHPGSVTL